ncbi:MAG: hypothetical protein V1853_00355 [bacterium]
MKVKKPTKIMSQEAQYMGPSPEMKAAAEAAAESVPESKEKDSEDAIIIDGIEAAKDLSPEGLQKLIKSLEEMNIKNLPN